LDSVLDFAGLGGTKGGTAWKWEKNH
jgi:hypothetical protein